MFFILGFRCFLKCFFQGFLSKSKFTSDFAFLQMFLLPREGVVGPRDPEIPP